MRTMPAIVCSAIVLLLVCSSLSFADWSNPVWEDDFEDGNYTANPTWTVLGTPGVTQTVTTWSGDYAFHHNAPYVAAAGAGWSAAYVSVLEANQGIEGWVDMSQQTSTSWGALFMLRYSPPTLGFGTGYGLAMSHTGVGDLMAATLFELNDTTYAPITDPFMLSASGATLRARMLVEGSGSNILLQARVWSDGDVEPLVWNLSSANPGASPGILHNYNNGYGGVGALSSADGTTADAYFDDVKYGTPEPTTIVLLATGIGALILRRRRA